MLVNNKGIKYKNKSYKENYLLTVTIKVDSALATKTNTSASKQCLSIHSSKLGVTSTPGESTKTTSSLSKRHLQISHS